MKKYYIDANVILRFLLRDNETLYKRAYKYILRAQKSSLKLVLISEIVLEINYVLRGVYGLTRQQTAEKIKAIMLTSYIHVPERAILLSAINKYSQINVDLADLILGEKANNDNAKVLSFDYSDFRKIQKLAY